MKCTNWKIFEFGQFYLHTYVCTCTPFGILPTEMDGYLSNEATFCPTDITLVST